MCCVLCLGLSQRRKSQSCGGSAGFGPLPVPGQVFSLGEVVLVIDTDCQLHFLSCFYCFFILSFLKEEDQSNLGCFLIAVEARVEVHSKA